jgi:hypothetical protein
MDDRYNEALSLLKNFTGIPEKETIKNIDDVITFLENNISSLSCSLDRMTEEILGSLDIMASDCLGAVIEKELSKEKKSSPVLSDILNFLGKTRFKNDFENILSTVVDIKNAEDKKDKSNGITSADKQEERCNKLLEESEKIRSALKKSKDSLEVFITAKNIIEGR